MVVSFIIYGVTILSAFGGRFDTEFFSLPAMLTLGMPWFAIATLVITILWFCFKRIIPGAIGVLAILVSWGPISNVCPVGFSRNPTPGAKTFTVMTYNMIHGWDQEGEVSDRNRTIDFILQSGADIVCLQEARIMKPGGDIPNFTEEQYAELKKVYPYIVGSSTVDIKLLSKYPAEYEKRYNPYQKNKFWEYAVFKVNVDGRRLTFLVTHLTSFLLTSKERDVITEINSVQMAKRSYRELKGDIRRKLSKGFERRKADASRVREIIDSIDGPLIVCGDFNDVPESYAYRLIRGEDLHDAYVETGFGPLVTYNQHMFWFHLDQMLYRGDLKALNIRKERVKLSDHYPLIAEFEFTDDKRK